MRSDWIAYEAEQKGIEKGIEQGIETGKEAGNEERKIKTIVNMFKKHMDQKDIMEVCEVTADELVKILQDAGCIKQQPGHTVQCFILKCKKRLIRRPASFD